MYVFDTVLEPKTSLLGDARLQRLIFRLPHEVMATAKRDRRRRLKTPERCESSRPPWDAQGRVHFSYSGKTSISTPMPGSDWMSPRPETEDVASW